MIRTLLSSALPTLFGVTTAVLLPTVSGAQSGGLERVDPLPSVEAPRERMRRLFTGEFDGHEWVELLGVTDLDEREAFYKILVRRARVDPQARAFVERLAKDPNRPGQSWTARLALRELGRANFPLHNLFRMDTVGPDQNIEDFFAELLQDRGLMLPLGQAQALQPGAANTRRNVEISQGSEGARVEVVETKNGAEERRSYEGKSIEEILENNPELKDELGLGLQSFGGQGNIRLKFLAPQTGRHGLLNPKDNVFRRLDPFLGGDPSKRPVVSPQSENVPIRTDKLGVKVAPVTVEHADMLGLEHGIGLYVLSTAPGTLAYLFGVRRGHVLLKLNEHELRDPDDIKAVVENRDPRISLDLLWIDEFGQPRGRRWTPGVPKKKAPEKK